MLKARVNQKFDFTIEPGQLKVDSISVKDGVFHVLKNNRSFIAEVLRANSEEKSFIIRVNGNKYTVQLKDQYDELLEKLGMSNSAAARVKDLKAPMPGLVVDVRVKEGDVLKKGDAVVVLQAMKMENVLKSPADVVVKKVHVKKDDAIEKNQLIVSF